MIKLAIFSTMGGAFALPVSSALALFFLIVAASSLVAKSRSQA